MRFLRKKREVSPLQVSEAELVAACTRLQSYFPDEIPLEFDEVVLHPLLLKKSVEDLLRRSVNLGDKKLFEFVNSVCYSASDIFYELKPDEIAQFLSDEFHLYLHVFHNYQSDVIIRTAALSLIQAYRIKLINSPKEQEVLEYLSTRDSELYLFFDSPISESFNAP